MEPLRHGGMGQLFDGVRAPSTPGTFLRTFTFGHVRQLDPVAARFLARLAVKATYGYAKQGAGYGYTGVKGLNALIATVSSPLAAPLIVGTRLRKGSANSARPAALLLLLVCADGGGGGGGRHPTGRAIGSVQPCIRGMRVSATEGARAG